VDCRELRFSVCADGLRNVSADADGAMAVLQFSWSFQKYAGWLFFEKKPFQGITFPLHQLENRYI
jgi:hypothetical protein